MQSGAARSDEGASMNNWHVISETAQNMEKLGIQRRHDCLWLQPTTSSDRDEADL